MLFNKKYFLPLLMIGVTLSLQGVAQKKQYTMAEAVNGLSGELAPKGLKNVQWRPGTHELYWIEKDTAPNAYVDKNNFDDYYGALTEYNKYSKVSKIWIGKDSWYYTIGDSLAINSEGENYHGRSILSTKLPTHWANLWFCPTTKDYAFTLNNNLFIGKGYHSSVPITADTNPNIINGQPVHRDEFGITTGIFFSPKGNFLAYYRMDQTMVKDYPVIDWSEIPAKATNVKYPMAGDSSHQVTLRVYNIATQQTITLKTDEVGVRRGVPEPDHYLTCVTWSPDEQYIYVGVLNRGQNDLKLCRFSAATGELVGMRRGAYPFEDTSTRRGAYLLEEKSDKYVEPQHPLSFIPGSNTQFIWWSQRDGYMHLWLCDMEKNTIKCLTPGDYVVNELIGFNKRTGEVLLTSAKEDPREKHGYAVNWKSGRMRRLDTEPGTHTYTASDDGEYLFDTYSFDMGSTRIVMQGSPSGQEEIFAVPFPRVSLIRAANGEIKKYLTQSSTTLESFERPQIQDKIFKAKDGTTLYGRLILPTNLNSFKKYPVIVYLYNGPHVQLVKNAFPASGNLWYEYLAQHGYIVWVMDGRGSSNRGLKFEQATFRHLGTVEMEDQLCGVEYLKSLPFVDSTRMGVHGWSFGGFMTTSLMLRHPGVFKVGVAGGPVMDWRMYEIMYGERYMDTPDENPEGYKEASLFDKAKNLKGKLLLIHGTQDATVVWQHSIKFLKASVDQGVQVDYFVYPGYEHNVRGKDRVHLMQKVTDYFDTFLK